MTIADAKRDLDWLTLVWGDLMQSRIKGSPRTWLQTPTTKPETVREGDDLVTVNGMPAPVHLDVLDQIVDVVSWADETAEHVAQVLGMDRLPHADSAYADPRPFLRLIRDNLSALFRDEPGLAEVVADEARTRARGAERLLGMNRFGQVLDCDCPYCGQERALTVVVLDGADPLVVCMGRCWMDDDQSGHATWRGRRAWSYPDGWTQLAKILEGSSA